MTGVVAETSGGCEAPRIEGNGMPARSPSLSALAAGLLASVSIFGRPAPAPPDDEPRAEAADDKPRDDRAEFTTEMAGILQPDFKDRPRLPEEIEAAGLA